MKITSFFVFALICANEFNVVVSNLTEFDLNSVLAKLDTVSNLFHLFRQSEIKTIFFSAFSTTKW